MEDETTRRFTRVNILGVGVSAINMKQAVALFQEWIAADDQHYVCVTPAHSVMDCYHSPSLRAVFNASGMATPDGMSIVWLLKWSGQRHVSRVYGPDLMRNVCRSSVAEGWRHVFYGGAAGVPELLKSKLETEYPGLQIVGTYSPPFRPLTEEEDQAIVNRINEWNPHIIWVGVGSPKQEMWMSAHIGKLKANVIVGVGAAFDFLSGQKPQAPVWVQRAGAEWLFRLATEPKRLMHRYAQYPLFAALVLGQMLGLRQYPLQLSGSEDDVPALTFFRH